LRDTRLVAATLARAFDIREAARRSLQDQLRLELAAREVLLVLDNFEQLTAAAPLLADLLAGCPALRLLVSSRSALRIRVERRFAVTPLADVDPDSPLPTIAEAAAVQLFVQSAQSVVRDFALTEANAADIARMCTHLDGLPLAIELAAARVGVLQPQELLARLEHRLNLTGGAADLPERQRTLRNTLAWSYELLAPVEQRVFRRLAVFAGGWTLEAAEAVCTDQELPADEVSERLRALIDSSLVYLTGDVDQDPRFGMLETVREYAQLQLDGSAETSAIRARHGEWWIAWAESVRPRLIGPDQAFWYARIAREMDNLRAARVWSRGAPSAAELELRLAAALGRFWWIRAPGSEGRQWLSEALQRDALDPSAAWARALTWSGQLELLHGDAGAGRIRLEQAVAIARLVGDARLISLTTRHLALYNADPHVAVDLLEEAIAVASAANDQRELALGLAYLATARDWLGDPVAARSLAERAVLAGRAAGDPAALVEALLRVGSERLLARDFSAARPVMMEALELSWAIDYRNYIGIIDRQLAWMDLDEGQALSACDHLLASLDVVRKSANGAEGLRPLKLAARLMLAVGRGGEAVRFLGAVEAWQRHHELEPERELWTRRWILPGDEDLLGEARGSLPEDEFLAARASGSLLSLDAALREAVEQVRGIQEELSGREPGGFAGSDVGMHGGVAAAGLDRG
jgi:predicted ATPase